MKIDEVTYRAAFVAYCKAVGLNPQHHPVVEGAIRQAIEAYEQAKPRATINEEAIAVMKQVRGMIGAQNDSLPPVIVECNINHAWHKLNDFIEAYEQAKKPTEQPVGCLDVEALIDRIKAWNGDSSYGCNHPNAQDAHYHHKNDHCVIAIQLQ